MTHYNRGDVVLVPFPFSDQTTTKKRPAVIISSNTYNDTFRDIVIMAITSQAIREGIKGAFRLGIRGE